MEYRQLGHSGLKVPVFSLGTATFGGNNEFFKTWGNVNVKEASRMIDICLGAEVNFFDTADIYSDGEAETILGKALQGKRHKALIATKATFPMSNNQNPNELGSSRQHLIRACENSLRRLGTDYIDIYFMHGFDAITPVEETLHTLETLITSGKIRYIGCSNFSGWHLMKSLGIAEKRGWSRYVVYQGYYSLVGREYEWELMPLGIDQGVGLMVWSPLGWGRLTGKIRRGQPIQSGRLQAGGSAGGPVVADDYLFDVIDVLDKIAVETKKTITQVALNWLLQRPSVCNIVIGARNEEQLLQNLGAFGWNLDSRQIAMLDAVSKRPLTYPYWHQAKFQQLIPQPVPWE